MYQIYSIHCDLFTSYNTSHHLDTIIINLSMDYQTNYDVRSGDANKQDAKTICDKLVHNLKKHDNLILMILKLKGKTPNNAADY